MNYWIWKVYFCYSLVSEKFKHHRQTLVFFGEVVVTQQDLVNFHSSSPDTRSLLFLYRVWGTRQESWSRYMGRFFLFPSQIFTALPGITVYWSCFFFLEIFPLVLKTGLTWPTLEFAGGLIVMENLGEKWLRGDWVI